MAVGRQVYVAYSDYVCKNPFYELDMPIQCDLFNIKVDEICTRVGAGAP